MDDGRSHDGARRAPSSAPHGLAEHFRSWARYNRAANERLYAACGEVEDAVLARPTHASLGSILAILEHVLAADRIWMSRLEGAQAETPTRGLREPTLTSLAPLRRERERTDAAIEAMFGAAGEAFYGGTVRSVNSAGQEARDPVPIAVQHMFNHQTHHRGQVHVLLREVRRKSLVLDMHRILNPIGG